jgi:GcrA cell cycle regulator
VILQQTAWSAADDKILKILWDQGHSASEIGRSLNRTKNSVIGRSHRLKLEPRHNPTKHLTPGVVRPSRTREAVAQRTQERNTREASLGQPTIPPLKSEVRNVLVKINASMTDTSKSINHEPVSWDRFQNETSQSEERFLDSLPREYYREVERPQPFIKLRERPRTACMAPTGDRSITFECEEMSLPGKSYCKEHHALFYIKSRDFVPSTQQSYTPIKGRGW